VAAKTCWVDFHRTLLRLPRVEGVKGKLIGGSGMRESGWIMCDCARYHAFSRVSIFNEGVLEGSWIFMESSLRNGRDQTKYVNISTREAVGGRRDPTLKGGVTCGIPISAFVTKSKRCCGTNSLTVRSRWYQPCDVQQQATRANGMV